MLAHFWGPRKKNTPKMLAHFWGPRKKHPTGLRFAGTYVGAGVPDRPKTTPRKRCMTGLYPSKNAKAGDKFTPAFDSV